MTRLPFSTGVICFLVLIVMFMSRPVTAQLVLLDEAPRPEWNPQSSSLVRLMAHVRGEARPQSEDSADDPAAAARGAWRLLAAALIEYGVSLEPEGDEIAVMGWRLAMARSSFDEFSGGVGSEEPDPFMADLLEDFAERVQIGIAAIPTQAPWEVKTAVTEMTAPLRRVLEDRAPGGVVIWPRASEAMPQPGLERTPAAHRAMLREHLHALAGALAQSGLPAQHPVRTMYEARIAEYEAWVVRAFPIDDFAGEARPCPDEGALLAEDLARSEAAVAALGGVRETNVQRTLRDVLKAIEATAPLPWELHADETSRSWRRRMDIFVRAVTALPDRPKIESPSRLFAPVVRQLERAGRLAERTTVSALERLATDPQGWSDPGVIAGVTAMAEYREDLLRLPAMAQWPDRLAEMDGDAGRTIANWLRQWVEQLADPMRRDHARRNILRLEHELMLQSRLDGLLRQSEDRDFTSLTGGRAEELASAVSGHRSAWAQAWGRGQPDDALTQQLRDLALLSDVFADGATVLRSEGGRSPLAVWPGWEMVSVVLNRLSAELPIRVRLASTAAALRNWRTLHEECARIERELPVVRLMSSIRRDLEDEVSAAQMPAELMVRRAITPPPVDARWGEHLSALATICRFVFESEVARAARREEDAAAAWAYAARRAREVLQDARREKTADHAG